MQLHTSSIEMSRSCSLERQWVDHFIHLKGETRREVNMKAEALLAQWNEQYVRKLEIKNHLYLMHICHPQYLAMRSRTLVLFGVATSESVCISIK